MKFINEQISVSSVQSFAILDSLTSLAEHQEETTHLHNSPSNSLNIQCNTFCSGKTDNNNSLLPANVMESISTRSNNLLDLCHLNARTINNKSLVIKDYVVDNNINILALTETWQKPSSESDYAARDICPNGYVLTQQPRSKGNGGGVGLLYNSSLKIEKQESKSFKSFELMEVLLHTNSSTSRIVIIYRPPPSTSNGLSYTLFLDEFSSLLELFSIAPGKLIIIGDFNIHIDVSDDGNAKMFMDLLQSFNLTQHVSSPTHKGNHILDLIITRTHESCVTNVFVHDPAISDHSVIHCNLNVSKPLNPNKYVLFRKLRNIDNDCFHQDLLKSTLLSSPASTLSELCSQYDTVLSSLLENHAPLQRKRITVRPAAPWYSNEIAEQKRARRKLERCWRKSKLEVDRQRYINQCNLVKNLIFTTKMKYYSTLIEESGSDQRALFS